LRQGDLEDVAWVMMGQIGLAWHNKHERNNLEVKKKGLGKEKKTYF